MLAVLLTLALFEIPSPISSWKVSFSPEFALLRGDGSSMLVEGDAAYSYDAEGNLSHNFTLAFKPRFLFTGPDDSVWLHDGDRLLGVLNANNNLHWQKELPPPDVPPVIYHGYLAYVVEGRVLILDPQNGKARYTLHRNHNTGLLAVYKDKLLLSNPDGDIQSWHPDMGERPLFPAGENPPRYLTPNWDGDWARADGNGSLRVTCFNGRRWARNYYIEISTAPVWLQGEKKKQLVVATHGRAVYAYGERGEQLARRPLKGRPKALISMSPNSCLLVPNLVNRLVWYDSLSKTFHEDGVENYQILVKTTGSFVLLVDKDGIIRLYRRDPALL